MSLSELLLRLKTPRGRGVLRLEAVFILRRTSAERQLNRTSREKPQQKPRKSGISYAFTSLVAALPLSVR